MPTFTSQTADLAATRAAILRGEEGADSQLALDFFSQEQGRHPELYELYQALNEESPGDTTRLKNALTSAIESIYATKDGSSGFKTEYSTIPPSDEAKAWLSNLESDAHRFNKVIIETALAFRENAPGAAKAAFDAAHKSFCTSTAEKAGPIHQIAKDIPRTKFTIKKGDSILPITRTELDEHYKKATAIDPTQNYFQTSRDYIQKLTTEHKLGLTGEQIDYILACTDQNGFAAPAVNSLSIKLMLENKTTIQTNARSLIVDLDHGVKVTSSLHTIHTRTDADADGMNAAKRNPATPSSVISATADITELKADRLQFGLASSNVSPKFSILSTAAVPPLFPESAREAETSPPEDLMNKFCEGLALPCKTLEDARSYLAKRGGDENALVPPQALPYMIKHLTQKLHLTSEQERSLIQTAVSAQGMDPAESKSLSEIYFQLRVKDQIVKSEERVQNVRTKPLTVEAIQQLSKEMKRDVFGGRTDLSYEKLVINIASEKNIDLTIGAKLWYIGTRIANSVSRTLFGKGRNTEILGIKPSDFIPMPKSTPAPELPGAHKAVAVVAATSLEVGKSSPTQTEPPSPRTALEANAHPPLSSPSPPRPVSVGRTTGP